MDRATLKWKRDWARDVMAAGFAREGLFVHLIRGAQSPNLFAYEWQLRNSTKRNVDLALSMGRALGHDLNCGAVRISQGETGHIIVELPSPDPRILPYSALPPAQGEIIPLGTSIWNEPVFLNMGNHPHLLLAGATRTGKTTVMYVLAKGLAQTNVNFFFLNAKGKKKFPTGGGKLLGLACTPEESAKALIWLANELMPALEECHNVIPHYVFVDDVPDIVKTVPACRIALERLAQRAAESKIKLVLAAQGVSGEELGSTVVSDNIATRIIGASTNSGSSWRNSGRAGTGAELLRARGDMLVIIPGNPIPERFQAAFYVCNDHTEIPLAPWRNVEVKMETRGGHNAIEIQPVWKDWLGEQLGEEGFLRKGAIKGLMSRFGLSQSTAYRVKEMVLADERVS